MIHSNILLDPTGELTPRERERLPRPASIAGKTIGLLDISKPRGDIFLDELARLLRQEDVEIRRYTKPTFSRTAPVQLQQHMATECDLLIEALAD